MNFKEEALGHSVKHQVYLDIKLFTLVLGTILQCSIAAASVGCPVTVLQGQATGAVMLYPVSSVCQSYGNLKLLPSENPVLCVKIITLKCRHVFFTAFWFCFLERKINETLLISPFPLFLLTPIMKRKNSDLGEVNCLLLLYSLLNGIYIINFSKHQSLLTLIIPCGKRLVC